MRSSLFKVKMTNGPEGEHVKNDVSLFAFKNELANYSNNKKKEDFQVLDKNCSVHESKDYF